MVKLVRIGLLSVSLGALGCYDMERLDEGSQSSYLLVDDFESSQSSPQIPDFGPWTAFPFDRRGTGTMTHVGRAPGFAGTQSLVGDFLLTPAGDDFTGASLGSKAMSIPLDVRRFEALNVMARFDPGDSTLPGNIRFYADLNCDSAPPIVEGTRPLWVTDSMDYMDGNWRQFRLHEFREPSGEPDKIDSAPESCLAVVDAIRFTLSMVVPNESVVAGQLYIDDVYFE
jgi:hypothetical protein